MPITVTVTETRKFLPAPPPPWNRYDLFRCPANFRVTGNTNPGCLVQHVERNEKTIGGPFSMKTLIASNDYWELWFVNAAGEVKPTHPLGFNDRFSVGGSAYVLTTMSGNVNVQSKLGTAGVWKIRGTLFWFDYDGDGPPQGWTLNGVGEAGGLPSRYGQPPQQLGTALRVRQIAGKWDFTGSRSLGQWVNAERPFPNANFRRQIGTRG